MRPVRTSPFVSDTGANNEQLTFLGTAEHVTLGSEQPSGR